MAKRKKFRNLHACHPIMRKGGVHEKSNGSKRAKAKRETFQEVRDSLSFYLQLLSKAQISFATCNVCSSIFSR